MTTSTAEVLGVLARADKRYADRNDMTTADDGYLEHLTAAVVAHITGKQRYRSVLLRNVCAALLAEDFDPDGDLADQAEESVRIVGQIQEYLTALQSRSRAAPRPVQEVA